MTRVGVSGAAGRLGQVITSAIDDAADLDLGPLYAPGHGGVFTGEASDLSSCDVIVEVTNPDVVMANLTTWRSLDCHVVVGTSGFDGARLYALGELWGSGPPNCLVVPNFSIGAVLMMRFATEASPHFAGAEIVELHHDGKRDAPSGTAVATAAAMDRGSAGGGDPRRGFEVDGVNIHSIRLPGLLAHQEVLLGNHGEILTIRHDTTDRAAFVPGALLAIRSVAGQAEPVSVGLDHLL